MIRLGILLGDRTQVLTLRKVYTELLKLQTRVPSISQHVHYDTRSFSLAHGYSVEGAFSLSTRGDQTWMIAVHSEDRRNASQSFLWGSDPCLYPRAVSQR